MANTIKIKRSTTTQTPNALAEGELAYSEASGNLFIGISGANVATVGGATDHTKLGNVASNANNYSHPTGEGNKHVPAAAATDAGKVLSTTAAGALSWVTSNDYSHPTADGSKHVPTGGTSGQVLSTDGSGTYTWVTKNNYSHPSADGDGHVPLTGTTNDGKVLKAGATAGTYSWENEYSYTLPTASNTALGGIKVGTNLSVDANGVLSSTDTDTVYSHPTGEGNKHVPVAAAGDDGKVLSTDAAGTLSWVTKNDYSHPVGEGNKHVPAATNSDGGKVLSTAANGTLSWVTKNDYSHPTGDGNYHLPIVGTLGTEAGHVLKAGAVAGEHSWEPEFTYTHPTTAGNKHVPTGGATGQLLGYSASGTAAWVDNPTVVDSLNSTDTTAPLSANMGREIYKRNAEMIKWSTPHRYHDHDTLVFYEVQALSDLATSIASQVVNTSSAFPELDALVTEMVAGIQNGDINADGVLSTSDYITVLQFATQQVVDEGASSQIGQYLINAMVADPATYATWHSTGYLKTSGGALSGDITVPDTASMGFVGNTFSSSDVTAWNAAASWHDTMTTADTDDIINTVNEIITAFEGHTEGLNLITELDAKLDAASTIDGGTF